MYRQGCTEIRTHIFGWWEHKMVLPLWKTVCQFFKMFKHRLPFDPPIPPLCVYPGELKTCPQENLYMNDPSSIIYNNQQIETTQISISG